MKRPLQSLFLIALLAIAAVVASCYIGVGQAENVKGILYSDTTWTKVHSPYNIAGHVLVSEGVTLTVESGVNVVFLGDFNIQVNGTLIAEGTEVDPIVFNGEAARYNSWITFGLTSQSWDEQTGAGCIIKNAVFTNRTAKVVYGSSPMISNNDLTLAGIDVNGGGKPQIISNRLNGICVGGASESGGSPTIEHNIVDGNFVVVRGAPAISYNTLNAGLQIKGGTPVISNNTINSYVSIDAYAGSFMITNNVISGLYQSVVYVRGHGSIINNQIISQVGREGINLWHNFGYIVGNTISNCSTAITGAATDFTIHGNNITENHVGIYCSSTSEVVNAVITNNLLSKNKIGIEVNCPIITVKSNTITDNDVGIRFVRIAQTNAPTVKDNNIYGNSQYNLKSETSSDLSVSGNWWGTTDSEAIKRGIYDYSDDFYSGKVTFEPFLTQANSDALPDSNEPMPSPEVAPTPTVSASTTPVQVPTMFMPSREQVDVGLGWVWWVVGVLCVAVAGLAAALAFALKKLTKQQCPP